MPSRTMVRTRRTRLRPLAALAVAMSVILSSLVFAPAAQAADPTPSTGDVTTAHPRLMANAARIEQVRTQSSQDPFSKVLSDRVIAAAEGLRGASRIDFTVSGGRMLRSATELGDRSYTLVVAWILSGDKSYLDLLWKDLGPATQLSSWNPDHMLDGAELTYAAAIAYDWANEAWSDAQRSQLRIAIVKLGLEPSLKIYSLDSGAKSPYRYLGNWREAKTNINTIINAAMIIGALAVANDSTSSTVQSVLTGASKSIRSGLAEYDADGGFPEGATYWAYATRLATAALLSLKSATGGDYGLASVGGLAKTAAFALDLRSNDDSLYNFADSFSLPGVINLPLAGLGRLYGKPSLGAAATMDVAGANTRAAQQLMMRDPGWKDATATTGSLNASYATGVSIARSSTTSADATYVAFRSSNGYAASHQHIDSGDFQLSALGQEWAVELGLEQATYDLDDPGRTSARWNYYRTSPIGHNTVTIDPTNAGAASPSATALGTKSASPDTFFATTNATPMFGESVSSWKRGVRLFDGRTQALVQDEITSSTAVDALWGMHTRAVIDISSDGRQAVLAQNGERLLARIVSGGDATFTDMPAAALPSSPQPDQEPNDGVRRLSIWFSVAAGSTTTLAVQFTPLTLGMDAGAPPSAASLTPLSSWKALGAASTLSGLTVGGKSVPGFSAQTASYDVPVTDPDALPTVAGTGSGKISVEQATRSTMAARITVSDGSLRSTTYLVRFVVAGDPAVVDGRVSRDPRSRTVDGKPDTVWDPASESSRSLVWRFAESVPLRSVMMTMSSGTYTATRLQFEVSTDRNTWSKPTTGTFTGPTATKAFAVGSGSPVRYVRLTVPSGDAQIAEAVFLRYDASGENVARPDPVPTTTTLSGFDPAPTVGATGQGGVTTTWSDGGAGVETTTRWVTGNAKALAISSSGEWKAVSRGAAQVGAVVTSADRVSATATAAISVSDPTRIRIPVMRDSFAAGSAPSTNFGTSSIVLNKPTTSAAIERIGYLAFDLTPIMGREVRSAVLSVPAVIKDSSSVSTARVDLHTVTASWSESSLTYNSRPQSGATVGSLLATKTEQVQSANVTKSVSTLVKNKTKTASYALSQDNAGANAVLVSMPSRESGSGAYIEVVLAPASADPVPPARLGSVTFSGVPSRLIVGKTAQVTATSRSSTGGTFSRARLTYWSSDPSVLKVSSTGLVTAVKPGGATLKVTATADGIPVSSTIRVVVAKS